MRDKNERWGNFFTLTSEQIFLTEKSMRELSLLKRCVMGCKILEAKDGSGMNGAAVFYCSSSMWAFGPVMESVPEAEAFSKWLPGDPRTYEANTLEQKYFEFRSLTLAQKHEAGLCETLGVDYECPQCVKEHAEEVTA